jgi:hypothetical protein
MIQWEEKRLAALVDAAEHAIQRARYVFIAINIAGIIMVVAQFNAALPWIRHSVYRLAEIEQSKARTGIDSQMQPVRDVRLDLFERELAMMSVPLLGMKIHSSDLSVLGSLAMAVLSIWFYFSVRRENHVVAEIAQIANHALDDTTVPESTEKARYLFHAVAHYFVFTTTTERDTPRGEKPRVGARLVVKVLMYMPVWVPLVMVACDLLSMSLPLAWLRILPTYEIGWQRLYVFEAVEQVLRDCLGVAIAAYTFGRCRDAARFDDATRQELAKLEFRLA